MASQQAWDDYDNLDHAVAVFHSDISGTLKAELDRINDLYNAIVADPVRTAEVASLADLHPTINAAYLTVEIGKILTLRTWLIVNGYIVE